MAIITSKSMKIWDIPGFFSVKTFFYFVFICPEKKGYWAFCGINILRLYNVELLIWLPSITWKY